MLKLRLKLHKTSMKIPEDGSSQTNLKFLKMCFHFVITEHKLVGNNVLILN